MKRLIGILLAKIAARLNICVAVNVISDGKIKPRNIFYPAIAIDCEADRFRYLNYCRRLYATLDTYNEEGGKMYIKSSNKKNCIVINMDRILYYNSFELDENEYSIVFYFAADAVIYKEWQYDNKEKWAFDLLKIEEICGISDLCSEDRKESCYLCQKIFNYTEVRRIIYGDNQVKYICAGCDNE